MKIAVLVKRVPDTASVFTISESGKSVELSGLKFVMSPYDEHALEEAIKLQGQVGGEVSEQISCLYRTLREEERVLQ